MIQVLVCSTHLQVQVLFPAHRSPLIIKGLRFVLAASYPTVPPPAWKALFEPFYKPLHSVGALKAHGFRDMRVAIQRKGCGVVTGVLLNSLYIVSGAEGKQKPLPSLAWRRGLCFYAKAPMHSSSCAMLEQVTMGMAITLCRAKYRSDACVTSAALPSCCSHRSSSSLSGLP